MGIWLLLQRITDQQIDEFSNEELLKQFLHLPYSEHLEYWQNRPEQPDKHDTDKSFEPLHYLLTGKQTDEVDEKYSWRPPRKLIIRLENTTGRSNKFYELIIESYNVTTRFGTIGSLNDTFDCTLGGKHMVWQVADSMKGQFGLAGTQRLFSRAGFLENIFQTLADKIKGGYKVVFRDPLPPPVCPEVATQAPPKPKGVRGKKAGATQAKSGGSKGVKRRAASPPPVVAEDDEPAGGARRSKRARKETTKAKEARERKEAKKKQKEEEEEEEEKKEGDKEEKVEEKEKEKEKEEDKGKEKEEEGKEKEEEQPAAEAKKEDEAKAPIEFPWKLKLGDIKAELEARGLPTDGKKDVLVARLCMTLLGLDLPGSTFTVPAFDPCNYLVTGGREVGEGVFGYGPGRALTSEQVKAFSSALEAKTEEELKTRYNPELMDKLAIGPPGFYQDAQATWEYLLLHFDQLKKFVRETAEKDMGLILYLS